MVRTREEVEAHSEVSGVVEIAEGQGVGCMIASGFIRTEVGVLWGFPSRVRWAQYEGVVARVG